MKTITDETTKTLLLDEVCNFFRNSPTEQTFKGTTFQFFRLMVSNPFNNGIPIDMHSVGRVLDELTQAGHIQFINAESVWSISRSQLTHILQQQQPMNITTIQPNTLAEQLDIRAAIKRGDALEANAIGNSTAYPTGWIDMHIGPDHKPNFGLLRYRIKRLPEPKMVDSAPSPGPMFTADRFSERELLAIMSAVLIDSQIKRIDIKSIVEATTAAVAVAKGILNEIDRPV